MIVHGFAEHGGRYTHVAERLVAAGYAVHAADLRGHGRSQGKRTSIVRFVDYLDDVRTFISLVRQDARGTVLLGHSMGGLIALAFALRDAQFVDLLVLSAPAVLPGRVSPLTVGLGRAMSAVLPDAAVLKLPLHRISRDPGVVRDYKGDPLVFAMRVRARLGAELLDTMRTVDRQLPSLRAPLLVMQGSEDGLVDRASARFVYQHAGSPDKTLKVYPGLWHEIFNEPERDAVLDDVVSWLDTHTR